jgi:hypothetical protein
MHIGNQIARNETDNVSGGLAINLQNGLFQCLFLSDWFTFQNKVFALSCESYINRVYNMTTDHKVFQFLNTK